MRKKTYFHFILVLFITIIWSCTKEDEPLAIQTIESLTDTVYVKGQSPSEITFQIKGKNGESNNIESVTFYKSLEIRIPRFPVDSITYSQETLLKIVKEIPSELSISIEELIKDTEYRSIDDIPLGTTWKISWVVKLKDGQIIPSNRTAKIYFYCISNLAGIYKATNDFCQTTPLELYIAPDSISERPNRYILPDLTANHLAECAAQRVAMPIVIDVFCDKVEPTYRTFYGFRWHIIDGTWNSRTNTLTIRWTDTFSLDGQIVTSTFIRQ